MNNSSFAARSVAEGPHTLAPPSFDGHGWLVVINLALMTAATVLALMVVVKLVGDQWRHHHRDPWKSPASIYRLIGVLFSAGITLRCGAEAICLWGWNPADPATTGQYLMLKRLVDPFAVLCGLSCLVVYILSEPGMIEQQRKVPWPINMWLSLPMVRRMIWIVALSLIAAIGVVSTR